MEIEWPVLDTIYSDLKTTYCDRPVFFVHVSKNHEYILVFLHKIENISTKSKNEFKNFINYLHARYYDDLYCI